MQALKNMQAATHTKILNIRTKPLHVQRSVVQHENKNQSQQQNKKENKQIQNKIKKWFNTNKKKEKQGEINARERKQEQLAKPNIKTRLKSNKKK
jgi:hypothetical protein